MDYNEVLERINWENILSFIMCGAETELEEKEKEKLLNQLNSELPEKIHLGHRQVSQDIHDFAITVIKAAGAAETAKDLSDIEIDNLSEQLFADKSNLENLYLQFGVKIGFLLTLQLLKM